MITGKSGQIGSVLNKKMKPEEHKKMLIHLGWDVWNKNDKKSQNKCVEHTKEMVKHANANNMRFVFVSTSNNDNNEYVKAKRNAENCVKDHANDWMILKLPNVMGKGVLNLFIEKILKKENITCFGNKIEFVTLDEVVDFIRKWINNKLKFMTLRGRMIDDSLLKEIIEYVIKNI